MHAGQPEEGEAVLSPLRELDDPLLDMSGILPYTAVQKLFDPFFPEGELHYYWKSVYLDRLDEEAIATLTRAMAERPSPRSMISVWGLGGAMARPGPADTAVGDRSAPYVLEVLANWFDPADSERNIAWTREAFDTLGRFGSGQTNLNFPGLGGENGFVERAFGDNYQRLAALKRKYDPINLFRLNQNIEP